MLRATLSIIVLSAAALVGARAPALAAPPSSSVSAAPGENPKIGKEDREFFDDAAQGGLLEVKLGQHVVKQGASDEVKRFAQRMIDDHGKVNQRLADMARPQGLTVPQELDKKHQDELNRFSQLAGTKLDHEYVNQMVSEHKDDVKAFERQARDGKDPALKQFAATTLPTLHEHLTMARQIQEHLKK